MQCKHAQLDGSLTRCTKSECNLYGLTVSVGTCLGVRAGDEVIGGCRHYDGPERTPKAVEQANAITMPAFGPQKPALWRRIINVIPYIVERGKCTCGGRKISPDIYRWLWMLWYGWPFPLRLRSRRSWRSPMYLTDEIGCGCIKRLKDWLHREAKSKGPRP